MFSRITSKIFSYIFEPSFNLRGIGTLKPPHEMTAWDIDHHVMHNRVLQPEFLDRQVSGRKLIEIIKSCHSSAMQQPDWLTDYIRPKSKAAASIYIEAYLRYNYRISGDLNDKKNLILERVGLINPSFFIDIEKKVNIELECIDDELRESARIKCIERFPKNLEKLEDLLLLEKLKKGKELTFQLIEEELEDLLPVLIQEEKKIIPQKNTDYVFLGAAGSGKSTLVKEMGIDVTDYVILATDEYRRCSPPGMEAFEERKTNQGFVKTQDSAYLMKELILKMLSKSGPRPNLLFDAITLDQDAKNILSGSSVECVVACMPNLSVIPTRAYERAATSQNPADRNRYVHTTSLLNGHKKASACLLEGLPANVASILYDTNVPKGMPPRRMGTVDTRNGNHIVDIENLEVFSAFLGKANANQEAVRTAGLYKDPLLKKYQFTADDYYKALRVLALCPASVPYKPDNYSIRLKHEGLHYAEIVYEEKTFINELGISEKKSVYKLEIKNQEIFEERVRSDSSLQALLIGAFCTNTDKDLRIEIYELGKRNMLRFSVEGLLKL